MLPDDVAIRPGDTVRWVTHTKKEPHTVTFPQGPGSDPVDPLPTVCEAAPADALAPLQFPVAVAPYGCTTAGEVHIVPQPLGGTVISSRNTVASSGIISTPPGFPSSYSFSFPHSGTFAYHAASTTTDGRCQGKWGRGRVAAAHRSDLLRLAEPGGQAAFSSWRTLLARARGCGRRGEHTAGIRRPLFNALVCPSNSNLRRCKRISCGIWGLPVKWSVGVRCGHRASDDGELRDASRDDPERFEARSWPGRFYRY